MFYDLYIGFDKIERFATIEEAKAFAEKSGRIGVWNLLGKDYAETWDNTPETGVWEDTKIGRLPKFEKYQNRSRRSGVDSYLSEYGKLFVKFKDGSIYLYTTASVGAVKLGRLVGRAVSGFGLNRYIDEEVKDAYEKKVP